VRGTFEMREIDPAVDAFAEALESRPVAASAV
jgi:hypothetical protein